MARNQWIVKKLYKYHKTITKLKDPNNNNQVTRDQSRIPNILNEHFARVGTELASKLPTESNHMDYLKKLKSPDSSFFSKPISPDDVKQEILSLPHNKS